MRISFGESAETLQLLKEIRDATKEFVRELVAAADQNLAVQHAELIEAIKEITNRR